MDELPTARKSRRVAVICCNLLVSALYLVAQTARDFSRKPGVDPWSSGARTLPVPFRMLAYFAGDVMMLLAPFGVALLIALAYSKANQPRISDFQLSVIVSVLYTLLVALMFWQS